MAWFTVQYRGADGKSESVQIESADRAGVFAELKKRGISAIRVEEAKDRVKTVRSHHAKSNEIKLSVLRGALAGLIVVLLVGVSVWFVKREAPEQDQVQAETGGQKKVVEATPLAQLRGESQKERPQKIKELTEDERLLAGRDTNEWIVVTDPNTGKKHLSKLMRPGLKNQPPPYFARHSLNELDAIQYCEMGDPLIGVEIDDRFMRDLQEALIEKIEIDKDDDEDRVAHKEAMKATLKELREELKKGGDIKAIITDALKDRRRIAGLRDAMIEERQRMRSEGASEEEVVEYERACNKRLEELGARPMITKELMIKKGLERKGLLSE